MSGRLHKCKIQHKDNIHHAKCKNCVKYVKATLYILTRNTVYSVVLIVFLSGYPVVAVVRDGSAGGMQFFSVYLIIICLLFQ